MRTKDGRLYSGTLPKGCRMCARGAKMVLLVTGKCHRTCFYCPLSEAKRGRDVVYANETVIEDMSQILLEARQMRALGTGITGGEPLLALKRTIDIITALKKEFGPAHHIHLYTTGDFDPEQVRTLAKAGLDEIRFHPPVEDWTTDRPGFLPVFLASKKTGLATGIEIPAIPGMHKEMTALGRRFFGLGLDFLNLNELEVAEPNWKAFKKLGYETRGDGSAIKGSREAARKVMAALTGHSVHFCTSRYKDAVQLRKRLLRRARTVARPYQVITKDATLVFGIIEPEGDPAIFHEKLSGLLNGLRVPRSLYRFGPHRLELAPWVLETLVPCQSYKAYIIETYPSSDALEVERTPLN